MEGERKPVVSFEDMDVFQRAYRVSLEMHRASLTFPAVEQHALADQIRRASKSICANLAEGYGRQNGSKAEFARFVRMAVGSSDEMRVTRCGYGWAMPSISAMSTNQAGAGGVMTIKSSPGCCSALPTI